jgi:hypothetical protein
MLALQGSDSDQVNGIVERSGDDTAEKQEQESAANEAGEQGRHRSPRLCTLPAACCPLQSCILPNVQECWQKVWLMSLYD